MDQWMKDQNSNSEGGAHPRQLIKISPLLKVQNILLLKIFGLQEQIVYNRSKFQIMLNKACNKGKEIPRGEVDRPEYINVVFIIRVWDSCSMLNMKFIHNICEFVQGQSLGLKISPIRSPQSLQVFKDMSPKHHI